ncbi:hypothetical protein Dimus_003815 [Dionaea muscipula]
MKMKVYYKPMLAFVLAFILLSCVNGVLGRKLTSGLRVSSSVSTASETLRDVESRKEDPMVKVESVARSIPSSRSNPTQNKLKPPLKG